ncbi:hypothetical protein [Acetonema longum]|uniref:Uncharacterized protein n=1 Tax=Acetonema longum DSM 6540 TaxID=1009370 RepID=F7NJB4_9FIRM|nr:hypothetical protein [Acetonema longum]EGO63862.1 hypothetical protein ALO_10849 [Acetonema longum DSM 6540]
MVRLRKLVLAAFLAASLSAVNVYASSAVPAQEPETQEAQSEQQGQVKLFKATYSENNSEASIPQIDGMKDTALQDTINNTLKISIIPPNTSLKGDFEVTFYSPKLLGIHFQGVTSSSEGSQPSNIDKTVHIDLTTGKLYKLEDLFKPVDFERTIKKICLTNDSKLRITNTSPSIQWTYEDFSETWNKETGSFVLLSDSIIVYSVQPEGLRGYKIPYAELKSVINRNGALWKILQEGTVNIS